MALKQVLRQKLERIAKIVICTFLFLLLMSCIFNKNILETPINKKYTTLINSANTNNLNYKMTKNKIIPTAINHEITTALSYFTELENTVIHFKFKDNIKKSTMQAQPEFSSVFKSRKNRKYYIFINPIFKVENNILRTVDLPSDVLIGWIGHELGHIMDYEQQSGFNLLRFGLGYTFSDSFIRKAERTADSFAVRHGMRDYILRTKNYILNHIDISETYKARIKKYYLSPDEIMNLVNSDGTTDLP